jgi:hypothetical protein
MYLFTYVCFNKVVCNYKYIVLQGWKNYDLGGVLKEVVHVWFKVMHMHLPRRTKEAQKKISLRVFSVLAQIQLSLEEQTCSDFTLT